MLDRIAWELSTEPGSEGERRVDLGLSDHNDEVAPNAAGLPLNCFARLDSTSIIGGVVARTWGANCEILQLWVAPSHRRRGVASELMGRVEAEAKARGCSNVYLESFSFQSPEFYKTQGYAVAFEFGGFPDGVSKLIMRKALA
jgi:GNAT superfamily N-acetyltransferase